LDEASNEIKFDRVIVKLDHKPGHKTLIKSIISSRNKLKLTPDHYVIIFRNNKRIEVPSDLVKRGDRLIGPDSSDEIVSISTELVDSSELTQLYT
jgi:intein/homing endonuclease